jgi:hypothetical protein
MRNIVCCAALIATVASGPVSSRQGAPARRPDPLKPSPARGLRAEIRNVVQAIGLQGAPPRTATNERLYCDSLRLTLILAHDGQSSVPVSIDAIAVNAAAVAPAALGSGATCRVDRFSSQPHGIVEKNVFFVTLGDGAVRTRFLQDSTVAVRVDENNILTAPTRARAITLKPNEEPVSLDVIVQSLATEPRSLTFTISYDHDGAQTLTTEKVLVWR